MPADIGEAIGAIAVVRTNPEEGLQVAQRDALLLRAWPTRLQIHEDAVSLGIESQGLLGPHSGIEDERR